MKKILVLGGKPIGSKEIIERSQARGLYTIVTDYLPKSESIGKKLADESWDISTNSISELSDLCKKNKVDGIITGVHEFNINRLIDLSEKNCYPIYCNRSTWKYCDNKVYFKELCKKYNIQVTKDYLNCDDVINYPVIVKPTDSSGSRGFAICNNIEELKGSIKRALEFSSEKKVLIEDFIPYDTVIIHYTMYKGKCYYSGMSDKISKRFDSTGAKVMGLQIFPSKGETAYFEGLNEKTIYMLEDAGFKDGPIWIEAFYDGGNSFIFNEMGYRFGGSLTFYPVKYFYGIDQLDLIINNALGIKDVFEYERRKDDSQYCILPIHIKKGEIYKIEGIDKIKNIKGFEAFVQVHFEGDVIQDWGSAQQVFAYLHVSFQTREELKTTIINILSTIKVLDKNGQNLLFTLFDINEL